MLHEVPASRISPRNYPWWFRAKENGRSDVLLVERSRQQWEKCLHLHMYYLMVAAGTEYLLDPLFAGVKYRVADLRRTFWTAARSIGRWGFTSKYWCGIVDFIANHWSFAIPKDVAHVDPIAHLHKVFIWILSVLGWQGCMRSISIRPELTDGRPTGKDYAKIGFKCTNVVRWDHVPCSIVSH